MQCSEHMHVTPQTNLYRRLAMGIHSLNEFSTFVNQQLDQIELTNEHLAKAIALIKIAAHPNLEDCSEQTIQNFLWVLGEHIRVLSKPYII